MFKLYREPENREITVIGADPAEGHDYCAAVAKSKKHLDTFMVYHAQIESAQFGYELYKMAKYIKAKTGEYPVIAIERNLGMATIATLQNLHYPKLYRMHAIGMMDDSDSNKIGWHTNTATRPKMLDELKMSLRQHVNGIYDRQTISELESFVRNEKTGKPEAAEGSNDDLVVAEAIAWQVQQETSQTSEWEVLVANVPNEQYDEYGIPV